jgi:hypothetical protein
MATRITPTKDFDCVTAARPNGTPLSTTSYREGVEVTLSATCLAQAVAKGAHTPAPDDAPEPVADAPKTTAKVKG